MKPIKTILLFITFFLTPVSLFSTIQIPDKVIHKGKEYILHTNPLEEFFRIHPEKKPDFEFTSTALWRGYVATFEIIDDKLFIKDIEVENTKPDFTGNEWKSVLKDIFPDSDKIEADWFSGLLVLPYGKINNNIYMDYSDYLVIEIENGKLNKEKKFTRKEFNKFKKRQFEAFKSTSEYEKGKEQLKANDPKISDRICDEFIRNSITSYTTKILVD